MATLGHFFLNKINCWMGLRVFVIVAFDDDAPDPGLVFNLLV
jgi:hypothetical protein